MEPVDIGLEDVGQMASYTEGAENATYDGAAATAFNNAIPGTQRPRGARTPRGQPGCRVYVGNLSWDAAWQDLKDHMRGPAGDLDVVHVDIMTEASGRSKGCAIVEYSSPQHAQRAIAELNDTELFSRLIFVREDREITQGGPGNNANMHPHVPRGGYGRGGGGYHGGYQGGYGGYAHDYGYGGYHPRGGYRGGMHAGGYDGYGGGYGHAPGGYRGGGRGGYVPRGRGMHPARGFRGGGRGGYNGPPAGGGGGGGNSGGRRVYVGNLSWECQWQDLKDHMRAAGEVVHADVLSGPDGRSKGCGLVEFSSPEQAQRAIAELNDTELMGRMIFVREDRETR